MPREDRERAERQTARNLRGMELEREGNTDEAIALYEQNVREGFAGDWPYGRLVAIYTPRGQLEDVVRVLESGIAHLRSSRVRTVADRRALRQVFERRLAQVRKVLAQEHR